MLLLSSVFFKWWIKLLMDLKNAIESYLPSDKSKLNSRPPPGKKKRKKSRVPKYSNRLSATLPSLTCCPKELSLGYCLALKCMALSMVAHYYNSCVALHFIRFKLLCPSLSCLDLGSVSEFIFYFYQASITRLSPTLLWELFQDPMWIP